MHKLTVFFIIINILTERKITDNVLFKCQQNYTKVMKIHLCITDYYNFVKKFIFMMKVDFLQLKELHHQICTFKNILNFYHSIMNYTLYFINIMLMSFKMIINCSNMTLLLCFCL